MCRFQSYHICDLNANFSWFLQATNNATNLEIKLFNAAYKMVDSQEYMPLPKVPANRDLPSDTLSPEFPNPDDTADQNTGEHAQEKGKKKKIPVDKEAEAFLCETKGESDVFNDILKGDRHAHAFANEVRADFL